MSHHLITMANQIGQFFEANYGDTQKDALEHIQKFWPISMRHEMIQILSTAQADELSPFMRHVFELCVESQL